MKFSQRIGKTEIRTILQKDSMDNELKTKIWNSFYHDIVYHIRRNNPEILFTVTRNLWEDFFNKKADEFPGTDGALFNIKVWYNKLEWYEVYDFIEYLCLYGKKPLMLLLKLNFSKNCNEILENQLSAYRIIDYQVTSVSDEVEVESIENALKNNDKFKEVSIHLNASVSSLSNRENPDYRNSIKESISAVESICKIITSENTLGKALNNLEKSGIKINPSLKSAFEKLYTYTNDSKTGIRHALVEGDYSPDFDEAKFMLVTCTGFINYLKSKTI